MRFVISSMTNRSWLLLVLCLSAAALFAQRDRLAPPANLPTWEYRVLAPQEIAVGVYKQVEWYEVESLGAQGWELVSAASWVLRNDEHKVDPKRGQMEVAPKIVTQSYLAYYFKRQRPVPR